jgi:hypothetical protein
MRNFILRLAYAAFLILVFAATQLAQSTPVPPRNEIEVRGFYSIPSGEASFSTGNTPESTISFERDFDFRNELGFEARYTHRTASGKHKFLAEYTNTSWNRSTTLSRSFTFRGETYTANLAASADLKLTTFRGMYAYRWGTEKFRFGPMVDLGVVTTKINISGTTNNGARSAEGSASKFAATVGYDLDYDPIPQISLFHNLGGIAFKGDRLFHTEGGVKYFPMRNFGFSGGYKFQHYKLIVDPNFLQVRSHGPFFGGIVRF